MSPNKFIGSKDEGESILGMLKDAKHKEDSYSGMSKGQISTITDLISESEDEDWAQAVFCASIDFTQDIDEALQLTKETLSRQPKYKEITKPKINSTQRLLDSRQKE